MLKEKFVKKPTLAFADSEKPMRVKADASKFAIGAALCVKTENGWKCKEWCSIACVSSVTMKR